MAAENLEIEEFTAKVTWVTFQRTNHGQTPVELSAKIMCLVGFLMFLCSIRRVARMILKALKP